MKRTTIRPGQYTLLPTSPAIPGTFPRNFWDIEQVEQQPRRPLRVYYDRRLAKFRAWR